MPLPVGKPHHLVLERRAVARPDPRESRRCRAATRRCCAARDRAHASVRVQRGGRRPAAPIDPLRQERERHRRERRRAPRASRVEVDRCADRSRGGVPGLQPAPRQPERLAATRRARASAARRRAPPARVSAPTWISPFRNVPVVTTSAEHATSPAGSSSRTPATRPPSTTSDATSPKIHSMPGSARSAPPHPLARTRACRPARAATTPPGPRLRLSSLNWKPGGVDRVAHQAAERVDLAHQVALRRAADRRIARHVRDGVGRQRQQSPTRQPRRAAAYAASQPGVSRADHDDVEPVSMRPCPPTSRCRSGEKISVSTASGVPLARDLLQARRARRGRRPSTNSSWRRRPPPPAPRRASAACARSSNRACRTLVTRTSSSARSSPTSARTSRAARSSRPAPVAADTRTASGAGDPSAVELPRRAAGRSCSRPRRDRPIRESSSARSLGAQGHAAVDDHDDQVGGSRRAFGARARPRPPRRSRVRRQPAVSTSVERNARRRRTARSRRSRVVPGSAVTMARSPPTSALNRLDFPTFGRPTIASVRAFAQHAPRPRRGHQRAPAAPSARQRARHCLVVRDEVVALVGKVERRLEPRQHVEQRALDAADGLGQRAVQLVDGRAGLRRRHGVDQVGDGLGLDQVEAAVQVRAERELAGLGQPCPAVASRTSTICAEQPRVPVRARSRRRPRRCRSRAPGSRCRTTWSSALPATSRVDEPREAWRAVARAGASRPRQLAARSRMAAGPLRRTTPRPAAAGCASRWRRWCRSVENRRLQPSPASRHAQRTSCADSSHGCRLTVTLLLR